MWAEKDPLSGHNEKKNDWNTTTNIISSLLEYKLILMNKSAKWATQKTHTHTHSNSRWMQIQRAAHTKKKWERDIKKGIELKKQDTREDKKRNAVNRITMTDYCFSRSDHDNNTKCSAHNTEFSSVSLFFGYNVLIVCCLFGSFVCTPCNFHRVAGLGIYLCFFSAALLLCSILVLWCACHWNCHKFVQSQLFLGYLHRSQHWKL